MDNIKPEKKALVRLPEELHRKAREQAEIAGLSFNAFVVQAVQTKVDWGNPASSSPVSNFASLRAGYGTHDSLLNTMTSLASTADVETSTLAAQNAIATLSGRTPTESEGSKNGI